MEQHGGTNSFGKRDNNDSPKREEHRLRPQREMAQDHQDSYAPSYNRNQPRRNVDRYRPDEPHRPRVPSRSHVARYSSHPGPSTRDTTTQDSQTSPFETARTSLNSAAGSANTPEELEPAPLVSHPAEVVPSTEEKEAPSSRDEDEYELLCEHAGGPLRRFTKKMCDVITETITENCGDDSMSAIDILKQACINLSLKTGTTLEVHDCWLYWRKRGMETDIARWWPHSLDDVDREVADYRRLRSTKSDKARAAYAARLATVPVAPKTAGTTEASASSDPVEEPNDWPQEEKLLLFAKLKDKRRIQHRVRAGTLWRIVGLAMRGEGYTRGRDEYREWFEKYGRAYFKYDETRYYSQAGNPHVSTGRMQSGIMTPEDSPVGDARRRRRGDSHPNGGRVRLRGTIAPKSPSVPKTPKPNKPRMSTTVLHDMKSWLGGYRNIDKTAKVAEEYPLTLIKPSEGERFEPFTTEKQETYDPPPPATASPPRSPLFVTEDESQTERNIVPLALDSTSPHSSPAPVLIDAPSTMPDETDTPEERVESIGEMAPEQTMASDEKIESGEAMPEDENDTPSLQPNEIDNTQDGIQWTADEWGFATPPFMRPSETDVAWIDDYIDFESSRISATTDSSDTSTSTKHPSFDDSLTSNETIEKDPLLQPGSTSDVESKNNTSSESQAQLLREQQERTDLEISNLRANYLRVKAAEDDEQKKLDDTAQELDIMILRRAEQLKTQTAHLAEMQRIEAELEEKKKIKQALSIALEELELCG